jgi:hypothetical protein
VRRESAGFCLFRAFWRNINTMRFPAMARTSANTPGTNWHLVKRFRALPEKKTPLRLVPATALKAYMKPVSFARMIGQITDAMQAKSLTGSSAWRGSSALLS